MPFLANISLPGPSQVHCLTLCVYVLYDCMLGRCTEGHT